MHSCAAQTGGMTTGIFPLGSSGMRTLHRKRKTLFVPLTTPRSEGTDVPKAQTRKILLCS